MGWKVTYADLALRLSEVELAISGEPHIASLADCEAIGQIMMLAKRLSENSVAEFAYAIGHAPSIDAVNSMVNSFNDGIQMAARIGEYMPLFELPPKNAN